MRKMIRVESERRGMMRDVVEAGDAEDADKQTSRQSGRAAGGKRELCSVSFLRPLVQQGVDALSNTTTVPLQKSIYKTTNVEGKMEKTISIRDLFPKEK